MRLALWMSLVSLSIVVGCTRRTGELPDAGSSVRDAGRDAARPRLPDGGNDFAGAVVFDDEALAAVEASALPAGASPCRAPILARVERVIDGDTLSVRGESEIVDVHVRIIGVDTPEIAHEGQAAQCFGDEARRFSQQLAGRRVWLTFDNECFDRYDRLLAYVHVGAGAGDLWERQLLRRGFASVLTVGANRTFASMFERDESAASQARAGLWGACR